MRDALIGWSGFVGGALLRARSFDARFRSTDIATISGQSFDTIVCCGAPAEKWKANKDPHADRDRIATLIAALSRATATRVVLISTVDVYPRPNGVDEASAIEPSLQQPYGRHRLELEQFCAERFETVIVRLPALYGKGLKKNAIFDLLHDNEVFRIPGNACFQFYDVDRLWTDVERVIESGERLVNITSEPLEMNVVAREVFGRELPSPFMDGAPSYDVRSRHASLSAGRNGYWYDAAAELDGLREFVAREGTR